MNVGQSLVELSGRPAPALDATWRDNPVLSLEAYAPYGPAAPRRVYNLEIKDHHNYFAGGILVHNK
jgi:intein/homing endonuclease